MGHNRQEMTAVFTDLRAAHSPYRPLLAHSRTTMPAAIQLDNATIPHATDSISTP